MYKFFMTRIALGMLLAAPLSRAQAADSGTGDSVPPSTPEPQAAPPGPAPQASIPAPPPQPANSVPAPATAVPDGQWTYTSQYGWLWIPYGQAYTYVYAGSNVSYEYVYYPAFGWSWVSSPWVFDVGPSPYWGVHGRLGFAWYAHPWFQSRAVYHGGAYYHATPHYTAHASVGVHGAVGARGGSGFHGGGHGRR